MTFDENKLIQRMGQNKRWCVSAKNKAPLTFKLLENNEIYLYQPKTNDDLKTLEEINNIKQLSFGTRAYRCNASNDYVLTFDIEPTANSKQKALMLSLPFDYLELSKSGGYHGLIEIPENMRNDIKVQTIINSKNISKKEQWGVEIFTTNHFVTFTKNDITKNKAMDANKTLSYFIDFLYNNIMNSYKVTKELDMKEDINYQNVETIAKLLNKSDKKSIRETSQDLYYSDSQHKVDMSDWEYAIIFKFAVKIKYYLNTGDNKILKDIVSDSDIIETLYQLAIHNIPHRDKHDTLRNNEPYLKYQAKAAWKYIKE